MIHFRLEELNPRFLSSPIIYGSQVSQPGCWLGAGGAPAYAKTINKPGFGLSTQTFQAEEGILEIGCLFVMGECIPIAY